MNKQNPNYKIGLYVRNSSMGQDTPEGTIKNQEARLRHYVELRNASGQFGEIIQVYIDRSLSAKNMNRPAVQKLLQDVAKGKIDMVAVSELSRITRSVRDFGEVWELLKAQQCAFLSLRENVDTSNAAGEMVMYMLANIAQFERKQTAERVVANLRVRSSRGLYNGGPIALGYKRIEGKPGYLAIDEKNIGTVKKAFDYFLQYETLSRTAKALNKDGVKVAKYKQGGGRHRLGFFTVDVLHRILKNKAYKGIKSYSDENGELKEVKAVWQPIIETAKFDLVQEILKKNCSRRKPLKADHFPYFLTGLAVCKSCGDPMCGASAFGKYKKRYNYYIHAWANKKGATLAAETFRCDPHRVPAGKLQDAVFKNVHALANDRRFAEKIIQKAMKIHAQDGNSKEIRSLQSRISDYKANLDALVERLAELPKNVSASLLYKQMGKLEEAKSKALERLQALERTQGGSHHELPADFEDYRKFTALVSKSLAEEIDAEIRAKILRRLVHKVEVGTDGIVIHYYAGKDSIEGGGDASSPHFFEKKGLCSLTNGRPRGIRTPFSALGKPRSIQLNYGAIGERQ